MRDSIIKIGIVDDHAIVRSGLRQFLADQVDLRIVGEAGTARQALELVRTQAMDVLVLDLSLPGGSGLDVLPAIRAKAPSLGILVLSGYPAEQYAAQLLRKGANGYLNKECQPAEILQAVRTVAFGQPYVSPAIAALLSLQVRRDGNGRAPHEELSQREFQVFLKLAAGRTTTQAAAELSLSLKTVSTYRTRVLEKMGFKSNSELTYYALKNRLID